MQTEIIALTQFYGSVKLLTINMATGERDIIPFNALPKDQIAFGLFEVEDLEDEKTEENLTTVALLATPEGPLLFLNEITYHPDIKETKIEINDHGDFSHLKISHNNHFIFELHYKEKFGIGLHPFINSRNDFDFYFWLSGNINNPLLYETYTRTTIYIK